MAVGSMVQRHMLLTFMLRCLNALAGWENGIVRDPVYEEIEASDAHALRS